MNDLVQDFVSAVTKDFMAGLLERALSGTADPARDGHALLIDIAGFVAAWSPRHRLVISERLLETLQGPAKDVSRLRRFLPLVSAILLHDDTPRKLLLLLATKETLDQVLGVLEVEDPARERSGRYAAHVLICLHESAVTSSSDAIAKLRERVLSCDQSDFSVARLVLAYSFAVPTHATFDESALSRLVMQLLRALVTLPRGHEDESYIRPQIFRALGTHLVLWRSVY